MSVKELGYAGPRPTRTAARPRAPAERFGFGCYKFLSKELWEYTARLAEPIPACEPVRSRSLLLSGTQGAGLPVNGTTVSFEPWPFTTRLVRVFTYASCARSRRG